eukprot:UN00559
MNDEIFYIIADRSCLKGTKVLSLQEGSFEIDFEGTILRTHKRTHEIKALKKITRYEYISVTLKIAFGRQIF